MQTVATAPADVELHDAELHLLTEWGDPISRVRSRQAAVASVLLHLAGIVVLVSLPAGLFEGRPPRLAQHVRNTVTPLVEPLTEFNQRTPNRGKIAKEHDRDLV